MGRVDYFIVLRPFSVCGFMQGLWKTWDNNLGLENSWDFFISSPAIMKHFLSYEEISWDFLKI
jgi:hypothetical protein